MISLCWSSEISHRDKHMLAFLHFKQFSLVFDSAVKSSESFSVGNENRVTHLNTKESVLVGSVSWFLCLPNSIQEKSAPHMSVLSLCSLTFVSLTVLAPSVFLILKYLVVFSNLELAFVFEFLWSLDWLPGPGPSCSCCTVRIKKQNWIRQIHCFKHSHSAVLQTLKLF